MYKVKTEYWDVSGMIVEIRKVIEEIDHPMRSSEKWIMYINNKKFSFSKTKSGLTDCLPYRSVKIDEGYVSFNKGE